MITSPIFSVYKTLRFDIDLMVVSMPTLSFY